MSHKLFTVVSQWSDGSAIQQSLNSIVIAKDRDEAILMHTRDGDRRWPNMLHASSKLNCTDISGTARAFAEQYP